MTVNYVRGIRGAVTVEENTKEAIQQATKELLREIVEANRLRLEDIASAIFTVTPDLNADFPAYAAREAGWHQVPLMCMSEINVPEALGRCVRVLIHVNTPKGQEDMVHVYLGGAVRLRPDLSR
ncbi:chorismate mutase [Heliomicrobium modesticaldum Ice1]|uniref:chorismate mutase n=1 Tax=Heliobacterium modesticaldum (strain ATCC 51547 / Ice1) TaxID=498761 RepID=B0TFN2_HELMI|nr:chorismate mutase [Heliomicrobium modesticaldum]ABZ84462.1 chorismate mutase [Heliomicrobium modesticaldum Ice1]